MDKFQIIDGVVCIWLVIISNFINVHTGIWNKILFKIVPTLLAIWFGILAVGIKP